jgi:pimeloyl-ACP methyl ester carboxylesterase
MPLLHRALLLLVFGALAFGPITGLARATELPGQSIELPGVKLWVVDTGGDGIPIVLLHANSGTSEIWEKQLAAFGKAGYRVIAFDRRGWGKSMASEVAQPGSIAEDLDALADHLKLPKFHLLGIAGGGFAALDYAAWRHDRLRSLIIAASTGEFSEPVMKEFTARIEIAELRKLPTVYREVGPSYRGGDPDGTKRWIEIEEHSKQPGATSQPLRTKNTFAKMEAVTTPTLVLAGDADLLAPPALMRLWAEHMPNHVWDVVADSGHAISWEHADAFNDKVLAFIKQH